MESDNTPSPTSSIVEDAYAQALELAQPSAEPTHPVLPESGSLLETAEEEGLTEHGKFVQAVVVGEIEQPEETGRGTTSDLPPEVEQAERVDSPLDRFGLLEEETGAEEEKGLPGEAE